MFTVRDLAGESTTWKDGTPFVLAGCYAGLSDYDAGEYWQGFSQDGGFGEGNLLAMVGGFEVLVSTFPTNGNCYEMAVEYESQDEFCFYTGSWRPIFTCSGDEMWSQVTSQFRLVDTTSAMRDVPRAEWRRKYGNE